MREYWSSALPVLRRPVTEGRASEFGTLLKTRGDDEVLGPLGVALLQIGTEYTAGDRIVTDLIRQLTSQEIDEENAKWPSVAT
jgi:hypothetical protein